MQQMVLDLELQPSYCEADYHVSPAHELSYQHVMQTSQWLAHALLVCGSEGSGKTHLAHIWANKYCATFLNLTNLSPEGLNNLLRIIPVPYVVVDGIERADELLLFHTFNTIKELGGKLLMTTQVDPYYWQWHINDVSSRIKACEIMKLHEPDEQTLSVIMYKYASDHQLIVSSEVVSFILKHGERSYGYINRLMRALDKNSMQHKRPVTLFLVKQVIETGFFLSLS
ncbi:MAG: hypothetical protein IPP74_02050 [Alphaproteobacteria bacterium]|nr:hypothetical protein [Alphaproteobacteria bacterium]